MSNQTESFKGTKRTFWAAFAFYFIIAFEFFYMASPFAIYFYSVYAPGLDFLNRFQLSGWLTTIFLPHYAETKSVIINSHNVIGGIIATIGFLGFCFGAIQVYYNKLTKKGAVTGGIYNFIRHPQYFSFIVCSFGLLILWPRFLVLISFITMIFVYYLLAKAEENECEKKFGKSYIDYKEKTNMFLPFKLSFLNNLKTKLPESRFVKILLTIVLYFAVLISSIMIAYGLRYLTIDSLYSIYTKDNAFISVAAIDKNKLEKIINITTQSNEVKNKLVAGEKYLNYITPGEWFISEIPSNPDINGSYDHSGPSNYNRNLYKISFIKVDVSGNKNFQGKDIILNTIKKTPTIEVWIDLSKNSVTEIKNIPENYMYKNIPVPLY